MKLNLKLNIKYVLYLVVLFVNISSNISAYGGSYDDFFAAIKHDDAATINNLLQRGFDANTRDPKGQHGLYLAIQEPSLKAAAALIAWPQTQVESRNAADESPLMMASLKGLTEVVHQLVEKGADVNKPGWAPLHYAATNGHLEIMNLLLENHAYIDASSPNGSTPLMMAALYGSPSAVKLLLEAGADPMITNSQGMNAVNFAQRHGRMESAELIAAFVRARQPKGKW